MSIGQCLSQEENLIEIWNNGAGVPIEMHKEENIYVPELMFGSLLTSSDFNDREKKVKSVQIKLFNMQISANGFLHADDRRL